MYRKCSAILAALSVAQLSLGGAAPRCPLHGQAAHNESSGRQHSAAVMNCHAADWHAAPNVTPNGGTQSCDYSAPGGCVGMTSCTGQIATVESQHLAAVLRADQAWQRVLGLTPAPGRAPDPPPPRI
jgi:hypothetical protein